MVKTLKKLIKIALIAFLVLFVFVLLVGMGIHPLLILAVPAIFFAVRGILRHRRERKLDDYDVNAKWKPRADAEKYIDAYSVRRHFFDPRDTCPRCGSNNLICHSEFKSHDVGKVIESKDFTCQFCGFKGDLTKINGVLQPQGRKR